MKPLLLSPFALVLVGGCAATPAPAPSSLPPEPAETPPSNETPPDPPPAAKSTMTPRCAGSSLTFDETWSDACRTAKPEADPEATDEPPGIVLEVSPSATYVSGQKTKMSVAYVNHSDRDAVLFFRHRCLELEPSQMFTLLAVTSQGEGAAVEQDRPPAIPFSDEPCKLPYVRVTLPPGGKVSTFVAFEVSANTPIGPAARGPLAPGTYSVEVEGPLARKTPLAAKFSLVVTPR